LDTWTWIDAATTLPTALARGLAALVGSK